MNTKHQGLALPTLMVLLPIASLAALLALRNLWVNDHLLTAEADLLRAQHLAAAVMPLAVQDIVGLPTQNLRHTSGELTQTHAFFPSTLSEYALLRQRLATRTCSAGICAPTSPTAFLKASDWSTQIANAMAVDANASPYGSETAWYWIEIFVPETSPSFVYRITVLANGLKPGSRTVLQAIWMRDTATASTGQWHGWHVLQN